MTDWIPDLLPDNPPTWDDGDDQEKRDSLLLRDIEDALIDYGKYEAFDIVFDEDDVSMHVAENPELDELEYTEQCKAYARDIFPFVKQKLIKQLQWG